MVVPPKPMQGSLCWTLLPDWIKRVEPHPHLPLRIFLDSVSREKCFHTEKAETRTVNFCCLTAHCWRAKAACGAPCWPKQLVEGADRQTDSRGSVSLRLAPPPEAVCTALDRRMFFLAGSQSFPNVSGFCGPGPPPFFPPAHRTFHSPPSPQGNSFLPPEMLT